MTPSAITMAVLIPVAAICSLLALYALKNREQPEARTFIVLMFAVVLLAIANMGEVFATGIQGKLLWNNLSYFPLVILPVAFLVFSLRYTRRCHLVTSRNLAIVSAMPIAVIMLVWTNDLHHLYYSGVRLESLGDVNYLSRTYGYFTWLWLAYAYTLLMGGTVLLIGLFFNTPKVHRQQIGLVAFGAAVAWTGNIVYMVLNPFPYLDMTSVALLIAGFLFFLGMYRYRLFNITPIARMVVFDSLRHGVIVADRKGRVVDINSAALSLLRSRAEEVMDKSVSEAFSQRAELLEAITRGQRFQEISLGHGDAPFFLEMTVTPIMNYGMVEEGNLIVLEDVTEQRCSETQLRLAKEKIDMLNNVTSHDIMNRIMVIRGYTSLIEEWAVEPEPKEHLAKIVHATESVQKIVRFAKEYQEGKASAMDWRTPYPMFDLSAEQLDINMLELDRSLGRVELYTDPMLQRVFFNILENSLQHGEKVTRIRAFAEQNNGHLSIVIEDDGIGIDLRDKQVIFEHGFGRNTGFGLFYSKEMASVMGFSIEENGIPGQGARFEIRVPYGKFRWKDADAV